jgi:hypothetical protein
MYKILITIGMFPKFPGHFRQYGKNTVLYKVKIKISELFL